MSEQQHVLLIEDDPPMARVYQEYLRKEPYRISHADTGRAGLEALRAAPPDAVILDLRLPDMNGLEILRTVREQQIPTSVIVITAQGSIVTAVEAMRKVLRTSSSSPSPPTASFTPCATCWIGSA